jgi:peptidyl-prolyl cis-trans isomerase C
MAPPGAWRFAAASMLAGTLLWGLARAQVPGLARVGSRSIDVGAFSERLGRLAPFQRAQLGASWAEQRRGLLDLLLREALLEAEAARSDASLGSPRDTALARALLQELQRQAQAAGATPAQIADYHAAHRDQYAAPASILIWRILLRGEPEARQLLRELGKPGESSWSRLARERSIDNATHMRSGSLGYVAADGQTHMPQVRVAPGLFAAAERVRDGELVPEPVPEGDAFAVIWRRASHPAGPEPLQAAAADIRAALAAERFTTESRALLEQLRRDGLRDYQPAPLAGFEPRSLDVLEAALPARASSAPPVPVVLGPRNTDTGLR